MEANARRKILRRKIDFARTKISLLYEIGMHHGDGEAICANTKRCSTTSCIETLVPRLFGQFHCLDIVIALGDGNSESYRTKLGEPGVRKLSILFLEGPDSRTCSGES